MPACAVKQSIDWLDDKAANVTSQFGEDGLVAATLDRIGVQNRWCFEVGAADGMFYSNTKQWRDAGWHAVLIEADDALADQLRGFNSNTVQVFNSRVEPWTLDDTLEAAGAPADMDFGVIDVDGQDFWVWAGLQRYRPRVMLVEIATWPTKSVPPLGVDDRKTQAGLQMIEPLGRAKGYELVAVTHCNALFVRKDCMI